jgi:hypothetical protein
MTFQLRSPASCYLQPITAVKQSLRCPSSPKSQLPATRFQSLPALYAHILVAASGSKPIHLLNVPSPNPPHDPWMMVCPATPHFNPQLILPAVYITASMHGHGTAANCIKRINCIQLRHPLWRSRTSPSSS